MRSSTSSKANGFRDWASFGGGRNAHPFCVQPGGAPPIPKYWLINDFRRFHRAFYQPDEALGWSSTGPQGFPLAPLLPITPRPTRPQSTESDGLRRDDLRAQRPEPQSAGDAGARDLRPRHARRCRETVRGNRRAIRPQGRLPAVEPRGRVDRFHPRGAREQGGRHHHQRRRLFAHLDRTARRHRRGQNPDGRSARQQHSRPRGFSPSFLYRPRRLCVAGRLRDRRLPACHNGPCRQDRRQSQN